jgi:hypothetical protein
MTDLLAVSLGPLPPDFTLDDYLSFPNPPTDVEYHGGCLCHCIATFDHGTKYIVRQRTGTKITYGFFDHKGLKKLLSTRTVRVRLPHEKKDKDVPYAKLLEVSEINHGFRDFEDVDFAGDNINCCHIWTGFAFPTDMGNLELIKPWLDHVKYVICGGNEKLYRIEIAKNAWTFQNPNQKLRWATVLLGRAGSGKGSYTDVLCSIWGERYSEPNISHIEQITGDNSRTTLSWKKLVVVNELSQAKAGSKEFETLKTMITDEVYKLRDLYQVPMTLKNVNNFFFVSNNWDSVVIKKDDRRYFILEVSPAKIGQIQEYFVPLHATFTDAMKSALLNYFLLFDCHAVPEFTPLKPAETELKTELREYWETGPQTFMQQHEISKDGETLDALYEQFEKWANDNHVNNKCATKENPRRSFAMQIRDFARKVKGKTGTLYFPLE